MVKFCFTLETLEPNPLRRQRSNFEGEWLPPTGLGANQHGQFLNEALSFEHNSNLHRTLQTQRFTGSLERLRSLKTFKVYSIYHNRDILYTVTCDATRFAIGDRQSSSGSSDDSDRDEDNTKWDPWRELSFSDISGGISGRGWSYAGRQLRSDRLIAQRNDSTWAQYLLPQRYWSRALNNRMPDVGLVGSLPILIGLVALSVPREQWAEIIPLCLCQPLAGAGRWHVPIVLQMMINSGPIERIGRDRQGVVVTILYDDTETTAQDLKNYEKGNNGPIFA